MATDHTVNHDFDADRLGIALRHLLADARLTHAEADSVRAEFAAVKATPERRPWITVLPEVGGYMGAALVSVLLAVGIAATVGLVAFIATPTTVDRAAATSAAMLTVAAYVFCRKPFLHVATLGSVASPVRPG